MDTPLSTLPTSTHDGSCILEAVPSAQPATGGWSNFLQNAKTKLYTFYKPGKEEFRYSGSPIWLLGSVHGPKSELESPERLTRLLLRPHTGLSTIERSYPDKLAAKTFVGIDAISWLQKEFPGTSRTDLVQAMEKLMSSGYVAPLGSIVPDFVLGGLYNFTPAAECLTMGSTSSEGRGVLRSSSDGSAARALPSAMQDFLSHFHSLIWCSYRQDFPPIEPTQLTSDVGWGCMLRTGQMMLANALVRLTLGPDFRLTSASPDDLKRHSEVLGWFADRPGARCPYSIHNIAHLGTHFKKNVGEWFGPSIIANVLKILVRKFSPLGLTLYLAQERVIYKENVALLCQCTPKHTLESPRLPAGSPSLLERPPDGEWRPVIILSACRLGLSDTLNPIYLPAMAELFRLPQCVGVVGGKPNASLYFVGIQDADVVYLDPHYVQSAASFDESTYHLLHPQKMPLEKIDPCMAVAFLAATRQEFLDLCQSLEKIAEDHPQSFVISVGDRDPHYGGPKSKASDPLSHLHFSP